MMENREMVWTKTENRIIKRVYEAKAQEKLEEVGQGQEVDFSG